MTDWRFGEFPEDGEAWLNNPAQLYAYVEYRSTKVQDGAEWRRLMVATRSWIEHHLSGVRIGAEPTWVALPTMLVLPNADGEQLREIVDRLMQEGGFDAYSSPIASAETSS